MGISNESGLRRLGDFGVRGSDTLMLALYVEIEGRIGFISFGAATAHKSHAVFGLFLGFFGDFKTGKLKVAHDGILIKFGRKMLSLI